MSPRTLTIIVILAIAAVGSWYLARSKQPQDGAAVPYDPVHQGYYLKSARILGTGENGKLLYEIEAENAVQAEKSRIEFTGVRIRYSPDTNVPWIVHADEATLREGSPRSALRGHVRAVGTSGAGGFLAKH